MSRSGIAPSHLIPATHLEVGDTIFFGYEVEVDTWEGKSSVTKVVFKDNTTQVFLSDTLQSIDIPIGNTVWVGTQE